MSKTQRATESRGLRTRLRLAIVLPTHWAVMMGGAEYQCKLLCEHLIGDGRFDVHWLSHRVAVGHRPDGYELHQFGTARSIGARAYFLDIPSLRRRLDDISPDIIYQRGASGLTWACARWAAAHGARMVWNAAADRDLILPSWHASALRKPLAWIDRQFASRGIRLAQCLVAQQAEQKRWLSERFGRPDVEIIANFHPLPVEPGVKDTQITVLWVGNFKVVKRPELFIALARQLASTGARFVMIGNPSADAALMQSLGETMADVPRLQYLGGLSQPEVNVWLARGHVLVNTSDFEGFSNTFIQAWMRGTPVVSLHANPDQLLGDGGLGACANGQWRSLVAQTRQAITDAAWRLAAGGRASAYARDHFGPPNAERLVSLMTRGLTPQTGVFARPA